MTFLVRAALKQTTPPRGIRPGSYVEADVLARGGAGGGGTLTFNLEEWQDFRRMLAVAAAGGASVHVVEEGM